MIQALDGFRNSNNGEGTVYIKVARNSDTNQHA